MRSDFEKHFLSLKFATEGSAQRCLDSCIFNPEQDAYLPDVNWISDNDMDECVIYCCMLNTTYISFKHQQTKVDELQTLLSLQRDRNKALENELTSSRNHGDELQKRVDAVVIEIEKLHLSGVIGFGTVKKLEQALKGDHA